MRTSMFEDQLCVAISIALGLKDFTFTVPHNPDTDPQVAAKFYDT